MDSGMGGISVLQSLVARMPGEHFIFLGDNAHAPYGTREEAEIRRLTWAIVDRLLARNVKAIVLACNTATSAAADDLRAHLSIPVLGLEPALKPAALYAKERRIAVLATEATLKLDKYHRLLARLSCNAVSIPCPELVSFVEQGDTNSESLMDCLRAKLDPRAVGDVAAIVLGCTHFVWLRPAIAKIAPAARVFDGNDGVARHLSDVLIEEKLTAGGDGGGYEIHSTSDDPQLRAMMRRFAEQSIE